MIAALCFWQAAIRSREWPCNESPLARIFVLSDSEMMQDARKGWPRPQSIDVEHIWQCFFFHFSSRTTNVKHWTNDGGGTCAYATEVPKIEIRPCFLQHVALQVPTEYLDLLYASTCLKVLVEVELPVPLSSLRMTCWFSAFPQLSHFLYRILLFETSSSTGGVFYVWRRLILCADVLLDLIDPLKKCNYSYFQAI